MDLRLFLLGLELDSVASIPTLTRIGFCKSLAVWDCPAHCGLHCARGLAWRGACIIDPIGVSLTLQKATISNTRLTIVKVHVEIDLERILLNGSQWRSEIKKEG
ncbi:hypothetical protein HAX54_025319 [Datura stramonium]|uniref:Uncharacterized protein n=1 Tax=Datura stramonium TaxID=4076 RepID=A0ABS8V0G8_DATST|nr:hypothetical protein [Datura stramonium]